jgi:2-iminobutanoate/2-iminopropanoate deaminase
MKTIVRFGTVAGLLLIFVIVWPGRQETRTDLGRQTFGIAPLIDLQWINLRRLSGIFHSALHTSDNFTDTRVFDGTAVRQPSTLTMHQAYLNDIQDRHLPQDESKLPRKTINVPGRDPQAPFSSAIMVGDTLLFVSGSVGIDPKTHKVPENVDDEIRYLLDGYKATLGQAGMSMDDLVYVQVFCSDLAYYDKFNAVYKTYFKKDLPARAFIGSGPLPSGGHFEMQAIAVPR